MVLMGTSMTPCFKSKGVLEGADRMMDNWRQTMARNRFLDMVIIEFFRGKLKLT